jgi:predicted dienelactone hydrolase
VRSKGMPNRFALVALAIWMGLAALARADVAKVSATLEDWRDAKRDRVVPVKIYAPANLSADAPAAAVLFSHGLGGTRENYGYLTQYWAARGFVVVALQHVGSDDSVWRGQKNVPARMIAAASAQNYVLRAQDVTFAIDELTRLSAPGSGHALSGKIDLKHVAIAGHSFGAHTTLAVAGQVAKAGAAEMSLADPRITCAIALSPAPPVRGDAETAYAKIAIPMYHLTGTNDRSPLQPIDPADRTIPYQKIAGVDQYLLVIKDADHMAFAGRGSQANRNLDAIQSSTTAFLNAYLRADAAAKSWLRDDFKRTTLRPADRFEWK